MSIKRVDAYRCPTCDRLWDTRSLADSCCPRDHEYAWDCGVDEALCGLYNGEFHPSQSDAEKCAAAAEAAAGCACGHPHRWHYGRLKTPAMCHEGTCSCRAFESRAAIAGASV